MQTGIKVMGSANKNREVPDVTFNPQNMPHDQDLIGGTCVEGLIFEEAHVASFSPASELANGRFAGCCGDKASLLSSLKL